ncbi:MAG: type II toxin-antitoxin system Phd/YefM family antitoxin [Niveispirillum sp.]|uniref:type II toxin-antitoxin system Phd/YefM family antitoxin n=1 Tax=Niveispirillum sp. TaxID=1917217 RepID=UPI003BA728A8
MEEELSAAEAAMQFGRLIDRARRGEETLITDHGRPVARVSPVDPVPVDAGNKSTNWDELWHRMRERARTEGVAPFTEEERKSLRDEGRR